jgi:hypothetical protein
MDKESQSVMDRLSQLGQSTQDFIGKHTGLGKAEPAPPPSITDNIGEWFSGVSQNPEVKNALIRGLLGATLAGGGVAAMRAMTPRDRDLSRSRHLISPALLAAVLGGVGAAGLPIGLKTLANEGGLRLPEEPESNAFRTGVDAITSGVASNPLATGGGIYGAYKTPKLMAKLDKAFPGSSKARPVKLKSNLPAVLKGKPGKPRFRMSGGKAGLLAAPVGVAAGHILDRILKGEA